MCAVSPWNIYKHLLACNFTSQVASIQSTLSVESRFRYMTISIFTIYTNL